MGKLYTEPSIGAFYQISINMAKWFNFREDFFLVGQSEQELPMAAMLVVW
jgi:hypothetical protein